MRALILLIAVLSVIVIVRVAEHNEPPIIINNVTYVSYQPEELIKDTFGMEWPLARAIAMAESHMNPVKVGDEDLTYVVDGNVYGDSIGLFQIRTYPERPPRELLKDPYINVNYAFRLRHKYKKGWKQWSAYTNGTYRKFLPILRPDKAKRRITWLQTQT